tara:strand:+ start:1363 stop:1557 length:195 start_codon:yes stop_codon:yes gene_type:complete
MTDTTPKQRYDARMALKRQAHEPGYKSDHIVSQEYAFDLAERFVSSCEAFAIAFAKNGIKGQNQ